MAAERGMMGSLPYLALGSGRPLVYLTGLLPVAGVDSRLAGRTAEFSAAPFARSRRVFVVNRRHALSRGLTLAALAAEHAEGIRACFEGPVDVLGISTGGSIAQQLAADWPDVVGRLVLVSTACRLSDYGRLVQRRVAERIRRGDSRGAIALLAWHLVPPWRGRVAAAATGWLLASGLGADGLDDMATTIEAEDGFDLAACRGPIRARTLIVAGAEDRFYGHGLLEETARLVACSRLHVLAGRGHVSVASDRRFVPTVTAFLEGA